MAESDYCLGELNPSSWVARTRARGAVELTESHLEVERKHNLNKSKCPESKIPNITQNPRLIKANPSRLTMVIATVHFNDKFSQANFTFAMLFANLKIRKFLHRKIENFMLRMRGFI